jgi:nucleoside-diphosphate-sugar epimerase
LSIPGPVLVTGATGFIGGFLTAELLGRGIRVFAPVRTAPGRTARQRAEGLLRYFGLPADSPLEAFAGDVELPGLGMEEGVARRVREEVGTVLHCAANTSFAARRADEVARVNLQGACNVFGAAGGLDRFWHMSTAYAVGAGPGVYREEPARRASFNNRYEESKNAAERELTRLCAARGTRLAVFRPSVVYGDSSSGRCLSFQALYYPVRTLLFLRDTAVRDIRRHGGGRAEALGVTMSGDGTVRMPLRFPGGGWLNMVPVDHLVRAVMAITQTDPAGVFHVVSPSPITVSDLLGYIGECFGITGIRVAEDIAGFDGPLQKLVNGYMELYYPYFCDRRRFDDARARSVLDPAGIGCPPLDLPAFRRCMEYAIRHRWGADLTF